MKVEIIAIFISQVAAGQDNAIIGMIVVFYGKGSSVADRLPAIFL